MKARGEGLGCLELGHRLDRELVDVGREVELAAGFELLREHGDELRFHDAALVMSRFEPRVREQDVKPIDRPRVEHTVQVHADVHVAECEIAQPLTLGLFEIGLHQLLADLEAHYEPVGMKTRELEAELRIGAPELHVDAANRPNLGRNSDSAGPWDLESQAERIDVLTDAAAAHEVRVICSAGVNWKAPRAMPIDSRRNRNPRGFPRG